MLEIIHNDSTCTVAIHPILQEEQFDSKDIAPEIHAKSKKRKCEWHTNHKVLKEILREPVTYTYDAQGKPLLNNRKEKISISHSKNYSAVIVSSERRVGIDIEELSPLIFKISERFVNELEQKFINNHDQKTELLYIIWCAKEALYKLSEISLDFKEHIFIKDFLLGNSGTFNAKIIHPQKNEKYVLHYRITSEYVLVWVVEFNSL